ncbi:MAG TPA: oligopeptidase B, partial [Cyanobacteria bacterium UBA11049]|nr:oligopeptidase B [Cyanobacteria bacterium UBA11049]
MNQQPSLQTTVTPPIAPKHPQLLVLHNDERVDNYFWMRERENPQVIAYLEAENAYTSAVMQHTEGLQVKLYEEMLDRIEETDLSVPYRLDDYYYYSRTESGLAYPIYCRKRSSLEAPEQVLLDQNQLAQGHEFFSLGVFKVSPNHQILAYSVDTTGAEQYTLFFLDLNTFELYPEKISQTYFSLAWANDSQTVFYTKLDAANRPFKLFRHSLGNSVNEDTLVYHEPDDAYFLSVGKTRSRAYILMKLNSTITSEVRYLGANNPTENFQLIQARTSGVEYEVEHHSDRFYILTNDEATNFKLVKAPVASPAKTNWQTVIPHREDIMLSSISVFANYLVIYERKGGLP